MFELLLQSAAELHPPAEGHSGPHVSLQDPARGGHGPRSGGEETQGGRGSIHGRAAACEGGEGGDGESQSRAGGEPETAETGQLPELIDMIRPSQPGFNKAEMFFSINNDNHHQG